MREVLLGDEPLTLEIVAEVARRQRTVGLAPAAAARMARSRSFIEQLVQVDAGGPSVYGVNTGFGALAEVRISGGQIRELQKNLVRSHAAGTGPPLAREVV